MYGNKTLPGISVSEKFRDENSIWRGYPESTYFKTRKISGFTGNLPAGTIVKENSATGVFSPITTSDIISEVANLPGARLGIVADATAEASESSDIVIVLIGFHGEVDKTKLFVGDTAFTELTEAQQINLNTQLEAWGFMLDDVMQA